MKKHSLLLITLLTVIITSCDNFLDVKPKAEIVEYVFFDTPEGFEDALYGVYAFLGDRDLYGESLSWGLVDQFAQYYKKDGYDKSTISILSLNHEEIKGSYAYIWNRAYEGIGYVNNIIRNLDRKSPNSMRYYNLYRGEALGLRAYLHFDLLRLFAPHIASQPDAQAIPYVDIYEAMVSPFKTVTEVYDLVVEDLLEAEKLLKEDEELYTFPRKFDIDNGFATCREIHFNLYAAQATLARVYWMKGDMENALKYAKRVIDSKKFPLEDKVNMKSFVAGTLAPSEAIWGLYNVNGLKRIKTSFYDYEKTLTWLPFDGYNDFYSVPQEDGIDMRASGWFRTLQGESETDKTPRCMKIVNEQKIKDEESGSSIGFIEGFNMIRIPEIYFIAIEGLLYSDPDAAQAYFDTFIVSRGLQKYADRPSAPTLGMKQILEERRKEFIQEGQYFYTMKRQNMDIEVVPLQRTIQASDKVYTLIIPDEEFEYRYTEEDKE